jgi:ABC-type glycerol-3-phosphate transport system substrate-binding protein
MKNKNLRLILFASLAVLLTLYITACSPEQNDTDTNDIPQPPHNDSASEATQIPDNLPEVEYDEVLTIAVLMDWVVLPVADRFMQENPGVKIEVISFNQEFFNLDLNTPRTQIATELMAGSGPVLIESWLLDTLDSRVFPFMVDWFEIMAADPDFNEDDWFMNVFHAMARDGRLFEFPHEFLYESVSVNSTIPGLVDAFSGRDTVNVSEMMHINQNLVTDSPKTIAAIFSPRWITRSYISEFLDMETGEVNFDNQRFIDLITEALIVMDTAGGGAFSIEYESQLRSNHVFAVDNPANTILRFLDFNVGTIFTNSAPLVDAEERLVISANSSFVLNAANSTPTQQALAWDFLKFLMQPGNQPIQLIFQQNVNRALMQHNVEQQLQRFVSIFQQRGWQLAVTEDEALEQVIDRMTAIGEMSMTRINGAVPQIIQDTINEVLQDFVDGLTTAEQTAQLLQNQITLIMMEMGLR